MSSRSKNFTEMKLHLLRFRRIDPKTDCWNWGKNQKYERPHICWKYKTIPVYRIAAHIWKGFSLDSPKFVCHHCDNSRCFNPNHLFIGTPKDNVMDGIYKGRYPRKLTAKNIKHIRRELSNGKTHRELARLYKIDHKMIGKIKIGEIYGYI